jgi:hypothetical protein
MQVKKFPPEDCCLKRCDAVLPATNFPFQSNQLLMCGTIHSAPHKCKPVSMTWILLQLYSMTWAIIRTE